MSDQDKVISLDKVRNERDQPDPEFVRQDDFGRPLYCFSCTYKFNDGDWTFQLWAYSMEDADSRVRAMNAHGVTLDGQLVESVPL